MEFHPTKIGCPAVCDRSILGMGCGLGYIAPVSTLVKWFPDCRGMATGLAIMGFGGRSFPRGLPESLAHEHDWKHHTTLQRPDSRLLAAFNAAPRGSPDPTISRANGMLPSNP